MDQALTLVAKVGCAARCDVCYRARVEARLKGEALVCRPLMMGCPVTTANENGEFGQMGFDRRFEPKPSAA